MNTDATRQSTAGSPSQPQPDDRDLFLQFRDHGERAAFDQVVHRYADELRRYLRHYVHNAALADDLLQTTFLHVYEKADQYDPARAFRPWLYSIATHAAIDALRKSRREATVSLDQPGSAGQATNAAARLVAVDPLTPAAVAVDDEQQEWTRQAVYDLPEHLRPVVLLVFYQGLKYAETADVLGIPVGTVKSRIHAALQKLGRRARELRSGGDA